MKALSLAFAIVLFASVVMAEQPAPAAPVNPQFERMKSLSGEWEGQSVEAGKTMPTRTTFKVVSDGSAVLNELDPGGKYNMVTMFHLDGTDVIATHYCSAHNQPRMRSAGKDTSNILFEFKDATNVGPSDGRMDHVRFIVTDADHHVQEWTYRMPDGKMQTGRFEFHRKGKS